MEQKINELQIKNYEFQQNFTNSQRNFETQQRDILSQMTKRNQVILQQDRENYRQKLEQEANEWLQKEILNQEIEFENKNKDLIRQYENKRREMENQIHDFSQNFALQNENNQLKQQLKDNQFLFETQKTVFISQIEKEKQEIEKNRIQLFNQFENERTKMENQIHVFSQNFGSLQNENNRLKQQLEDNQFLFETQKTEFISQIEKEKQESLQKEVKKIRIQLFNQFENERTKMENQIDALSDNVESLQNENNQLKQQLKDNQFLFETQKIEFISQIEKEKQEIEKIKIQLSEQIENDRREWNQLVQQFQCSFDNIILHQEEIFQLRFLFLNHLFFHHSFQKEEKETEYEFQTTLDSIFQNEENNLELFFS
jgi:hypothetical protein